MLSRAAEKGPGTPRRSIYMKARLPTPKGVILSVFLHESYPASPAASTPAIAAWGALVVEAYVALALPSVAFTPATSPAPTRHDPPWNVMHGAC